jgi:hypothetical protein
MARKTVRVKMLPDPIEVDEAEEASLRAEGLLVEDEAAGDDPGTPPGAGDAAGTPLTPARTET